VVVTAWDGAMGRPGTMTIFRCDARIWGLGGCLGVCALDLVHRMICILGRLYRRLDKRMPPYGACFEVGLEDGCRGTDQGVSISSIGEKSC